MWSFLLCNTHALQTGESTFASSVASADDSIRLVFSTLEASYTAVVVFVNLVA